MKDDRKSTSNTMAAGLPGLGVIPEAVRKSEESGRSSITASFTQPNMGKKSQDASYKQEDLPRISIQPPINPVPAEPKNRFKEELQEEKRPSRFANCLGFTDENDVAKANKHHLDDASIITEGVDVYEKLRQEQNALQDHQNKNSAHQTSEKQAAQKGVGPAQKTQERMSAGATSKTSSKRGQALVGEELPEVEDNMISMLYQQARILENRLEKQRSLDS